MPKIDPNKKSSTNESSEESRVIVNKVVGHLREMRRLEGELQSVLADSHAKFMAMLADDATSGKSTPAGEENSEQLTSVVYRR